MPGESFIEHLPKREDDSVIWDLVDEDKLSELESRTKALRFRLSANLDELAEEVHKTAVEKGFWREKDVIHRLTENGYADEETRNVLMHLLYGNKRDLIHTEVAETTEAVRKTQGDEKELDELSDIIIRLLDYYQGRKLYGDLKGSLQEALVKKVQANTERERLHGNLF